MLALFKHVHLSNIPLQIYCEKRKEGLNTLTLCNTRMIQI